jgi:hypothetical protein
MDNTPCKRPEFRIIAMTLEEYDAAMHQFLGKNYDEEIGDYWDYAMSEFDQAYEKNLEIVGMDDLGTQYFAVITDAKTGQHDQRLYELPESFNPNDFQFTESLLNHPYYDEDEQDDA